MPQPGQNHSQYQAPRTKGGMGATLVVIGAIFSLVPWLLPESVAIPAFGKFIITVLGLTAAFIGTMLVVVTHLYKTASADLAFVRTGKGGPQPCLSGGMLVVPFWHEIVWVSLQTVPIKIDKTTGSGISTPIRTEEGIPVDLEGVFYVAVEGSKEAVLAAAKSLGDAAGNPHAFSQLVEAKVDSALRTVTQGSSFDELNTNRKTFTDKVQGIVNEQLSPNGLKLEDVALTTFNQAPFGTLDENNILDARAKQIITETTSAAGVKVNALQRDAEKQKEEKNVETRKAILTMQLDKQQAENANALEVAKSLATTERETKVVQANAKRDTAIALSTADREEQIAKTSADQAKQEAVTNQQKALKILQQEADQAEQEAIIAKEQAVSVAEQKKLQEIADAKRALAEAESLRLAKEKEKAEAEQAVVTANELAKATRDKDIEVIKQEAASQKQVLSQNATADVEAYRTKTLATAKKEAAENEATAVTTAAEAKKKAAELEAAGDQAKKLVDVNIAKEQVDVERQKVEVEGTRLKQQTENAEISFKLRVEELTIEAEKVIGVAKYGALAAAYQTAKIEMFGTPDQILGMSKAFTDGKTFGKLLTSASESMPADLRDSVVGGTANILNAVAGLIKEKTGFEPTEAQVKELLAKHLPKGQVNGVATEGK